MKRFLPDASTLSILLLVVAGISCAQQKQQIPQHTVESFLKTTTYTGSSFSPDNTTILVSSDETGIFNAYAVSVRTGEKEQLTTSVGDAVYVGGYFPMDNRFLYRSDQGGNELDHLYVRELDGSVTDLTPGDSLKASFYDWSWDKETFLVGTNERDERFFDVYEYAADSYEREMIFRNDEGFQFADQSPDRRYLALAKAVTNADSDIYLYDRQTGSNVLITPDSEPVDNRSQGFTPDSKGLLYSTDKDSEFGYLARYDIEDRSVKVIEQVDWDIWGAGFSWGGKYLTVTINNDARTEMRLYDAATMERISMPELPGMNITSVAFSRDEEYMTFYAGSSRAPRNLYFYDFVESPRQLTSSMNPDIDVDHLVDGEVVRFDSYDGVVVPGILYRPHEASTTNKAAAIVYVHGGPGGQSRIGYNDLIQYLVNHGYAVYAINNRGSTGYGKSFFHLDDRLHGEADLDDVVESKRMLAESGWIDPERIGVLGGSYGGYMTLAALTFRPDAFEVGVDLFGISDWHRTVNSIPPWWGAMRDMLEQEMGDFEDDEFFKAKSPLFHADQITKPLLVVQGANDPRVLKVESDEIVEAVRANGVPVEYVLFDDEGHGFEKRENQEAAYLAIREFLDQYLKQTDE